jgi:hypothetical protein
MLNTRTLYLMTAVLLGLAAIEPSSADSQRKRSDAFEHVLPSFASAHDYWSASKISFQLASKHNRLNETQAACQALAQSLDYYRMALAKGTNPSAWEVAVVSGDDGDGMQEIRSRFGCTRTQFS